MNLKNKYKPVAVVYPDDDALEYVNRDCFCIYEYVDCNLAIIRDAQTRNVIGFKLNDWSKLYKP